MGAEVAAAWIAAGAGIAAAVVTVVVQVYAVGQENQRQQREQQFADRAARERDLRDAVERVVTTLQQLMAELDSALLLASERWLLPWAAQRWLTQVAPRRGAFVAAVFNARALGNPRLNACLDELVSALPEFGTVFADAPHISKERRNELTATIGTAQHVFVDQASALVHGRVAIDEDPGRPRSARSPGAATTAETTATTPSTCRVRRSGASEIPGPGQLTRASG